MVDATTKTHLEVLINGTMLRGYLDRPQTPGPHPLLIMFHGFTGDATESKFLLTRLAKGLTGQGIASLRLSFAGSGESDGDFYDTSCLKQAQEGEAILDFARSLPDVDVGRIALLGMSLGGCVATLVAGTREDQLKGLILLAPAFRYVEKYQKLYQTHDFFWHGNLQVGRSFLDDALGTDFKKILQTLTIPVRFFHGTGDKSVEPAVSQEFSTYPKDSELTLIEATDHGFDTKAGYLELSQGLESAVRQILLD